MKRINYVMGFLFVLTLTAFASCDKNETMTMDATKNTIEATKDYEKPYTEVLTEPKNHYSVGVRGKVYTSQGLLYSKILTQVTLTKLSQRNMATFSMEESESEYRVTVVRIKSSVDHTNIPEDICSDDSSEMSRFVLEAAMEDHSVKVWFDKESGMWHGFIVEK